jgi:hypothetical protein
VAHQDDFISLCFVMWSVLKLIRWPKLTVYMATSRERVIQGYVQSYAYRTLWYAKDVV